jgi:hypothetical protein
MALTETQLKLIIGSEALLELDSDEKAAILAKYSVGQEAACELFTFGLLAKKFRPSYRMGSTFEAESDKFRYYNERYLYLSKSAGAGALGLSAQESGHQPDRNDIERQKWVEPTRR